MEFMLKRLFSLSFVLAIITSTFMVDATRSSKNVPYSDYIHFVIIIPSYNNKNWFEKNLDSVLNQTFSNYHVIYIDDASTDNTGNLVAAYLKDKDKDKKVTLISNKKRVGALANIYNAVHDCDDRDVIVLLDGDDWLAHENVLARLFEEYGVKKNWLVYSQFEFLSTRHKGWNRACSKREYQNPHAPRNYSPSHLRSFYAGLFKKIKRADLMHEDNFFSMTWDMAIMLPMVEMASEGRVKFIPEVLYIYNDTNPLNDHRVNQTLQRNLFSTIAAKKKYSPLNSLDDSNIELLKDDAHFVIIVPSYNNKNWYHKTLDSILMQTYKNYKVIFINDGSCDGVQDLIDTYVREKDTEHKITLVNNSKRLGPLANMSHIIQHCNDNDLIVMLDGNDCFANENVLSTLSIAYANKVNWLVCSAKESYAPRLNGGVRPISAQLVTFYASLFKKIDLDDLQYQGNFITKYWDIALTKPMAAMASQKHTHFIEKKLVCAHDRYAQDEEKLQSIIPIIPIDSLEKKYLPLRWLIDDAEVATAEIEETDFVIVIPSYNNKDWYIKNLDSVLAQKYSNYHVVYINDCSADGTGDLVANYIKEHYYANRITLINNAKRLGALANIYNTVHDCKSNDVIVLLDGDDWLAHENVLSILNKTYANKKNWLVYSQFLQWPVNEVGWNRAFPKTDYQNPQVPREYSPSHLRTFYAGLFQKIRKEDLLYENDFYSMTWDMAIMLPMIEMASQGHVSFIPDVLYIYNLSNPISDHRKDLALQEKLHGIIAAKNKYVPLHCLCDEIK